MGFNKVFEQVMVGAEDKAIKDMEAKLFQIKHELVDNNLMSQEQKIALRNELIAINTALELLVVSSKNPNLNEDGEEEDDVDDLAKEACDAYKETKKKKVSEAQPAKRRVDPNAGKTSRVTRGREASLKKKGKTKSSARRVVGNDKNARSDEHDRVKSRRKAGGKGSDREAGDAVTTHKRSSSGAGVKRKTKDRPAGM